MKWIRLLAVLPMLFLGSAAYAAETINYQYDALGRQISTTRSSGTQTAYTLDASGNRVQVQAGAAAAPTTPPSITVPTNSTGSYTISWGASTSGIVTAYELYESTSAGFTPQTLVYNGTGTSLAVASKPDGTYYYRVRACNVGLCSGYRTGSNPVTVQIPAGPTITLDNVSVTGEAPLGTLSFTYGLASTGFVTISGNGVTVSGPARLYWLTPQTGMNQYQGRATSACNHNTGTFNSWDDLNLYAYVGNDPVNRLDPFGLYNCSGSQGDCAKVDAYTSKLNESLKNLDPKSKDYARVAAASKYLGKAGDNNGVTIKATQLPGRRFAQADKGDVIAIDVGKISTKATSADPDGVVVHGAGALGHEARHQIDNKSIFGSRGPQSKAQEYRTELNAFNTQGAVYRGLDRSTSLDTPEGVAAAAQSATDEWCSSGGNC